MLAFAKSIAVAAFVAVTFGLTAAASAAEVGLSSYPIAFMVPDEDRVVYFIQPDPTQCVLVASHYRLDANNKMDELLAEVITLVAEGDQPFALNPSNNVAGHHIVVTCESGQLVARGDYPVFR